MAYCPHCGQQQQQPPSAFCPGCGARNGEAEQRPRVSLPALVWALSAIGGVVIVALLTYANNTHRGVSTIASDIARAEATPTAVAYSCSDAQAAVQAYHKTMWPLMAELYPSLSIACDPTEQQRHGETADHPVVVSWQTSKGGETAMYLVSASGVVSPDDPNATHLDELAKYSPLLLKAALAGGL